MVRGGRRRRKGRTTRAEFAQFEVLDDLVYDIDARKLIELVQLRLGEHHRDSVLRGLHPSGRTMVALDPDSLDTDRYGHRSGRTFFYRSGKSARNWWLGPVTGTSIKASAVLKPQVIGGDGARIDWVVSAWLRRNIDLQSVRGAAAGAIGRAVDEMLRAAVGRTVATPVAAGAPERPLTAAGTHWPPRL